MKLNTAVVLLVVSILAIVSVCYLYVPAGATDSSVNVVPIVSVSSTGVLTIVSGTNPANNNAIEFGTVPAGSSSTKTLVLGVSANSAGWTLQVAKNQDLTDSSNGMTSIPSNSLRFTSAGPEGPTYVTAPTEFGFSATPTVVASGTTPISAANITVNYTLTMPPAQPVGYYSASHTYTLLVP